MNIVAHNEPSALADTVRTVPGVTNIFTPPSERAGIPQMIAAASAAADDGPIGDIVITTDEHGLPTVSARIATSLEDSTVGTARRVADALLAQSPPDARIVLQVARIK